MTKSLQQPHPDPGLASRREQLTGLGTALSLGSAALAAWLTVKPRTRGLTSNLLGYALKIIGGALSPLVAMAGLLGAVIGRKVRKSDITTLGGIGAILASHYVRRVSQPQDGLEQAFGADAVARVSDRLVRGRMLRRRWQLGQVVQHPAPMLYREVAFASLSVAESGADRDLKCDLWVPSPSVARSGLGVIYLHGGAWQSFDKDVATRSFFRHLGALGHVAMDVAYRMVAETDMAGMLGDVKRAIAWLKSNSDCLGVDPDKVIISGGSAGGHLALLAAYTPNSARFDPPDVRSADTSVRGVVAYYPVVDLRTLSEHWSEQAMNPLVHAAGRWLGYFTREGYLRWTELAGRLFDVPPDELEEWLLAFSPIAHVGPSCPPTLILQGLHDHVVPVGDVQCLHRALVDAGCHAVLTQLPQVEHAFDLFARQLSPPAQSALYDVERFLAILS